MTISKKNKKYSLGSLKTKHYSFKRQTGMCNSDPQQHDKGPQNLLPHAYLFFSTKCSLSFTLQFL